MEETKYVVITSIGLVSFEELSEGIKHPTLLSMFEELLRVQGKLKERKDLSYYCQKIANRKHCSPKEACDWLNAIQAVNPTAALNIILKEIAIDLDNYYPDHISNSKRIFAISAINGGIIEVRKSDIKNYNSFAAFRTVEDAQYARLVVKGRFKYLFKDAGK